jgi:hypothetical protein
LQAQTKDMKPRISIAALLGVMVPLAVGLTALANSTAWWEAAIFLLTTALLLVSVFGICYRRGAGRAFWVGFCVFGWGLMLLSCDNIINLRPGGSYPRAWYGTDDESNDDSIGVLTERFVDALQLVRRNLPHSVGEKVQVQWGSPGTYYPSTVLEMKDELFKIRYVSDRSGVYDEWVGPDRIKLEGRARCCRIARLLFIVAFALCGGLICLYFFVTRERPKLAVEQAKSSPV